MKVISQRCEQAGWLYNRCRFWYALGQPGVHVAICGAGTVGQMEDNIWAVQKLRKMTPEESADVRKRAVVGLGVYSGPTMEYWKKKA